MITRESKSEGIPDYRGRILKTVYQNSGTPFYIYVLRQDNDFGVVYYNHPDGYESTTGFANIIYEEID